MNPKPDSWDDYRSRKRWLVWTMAAFLPGIAIVGKSLECLFNTQVAVDIIGAAWVLAFLIAGWRFRTVRCLCCKREFYSSFLVNWKLSDEFPFAKRCSRCGLEKWKAPEAGDGEKKDC